VNEIWKIIPEFGNYEVSNVGRIKSRARKVWNGFAWHDLRERVMRLQVNRRGYSSVKMRKEGKTYTREVHRLMLITFQGLPDHPKAQSRHLDGNPKNNTLLNLCWGTAKENSDDKRSHGRMNIGERNGQAKLTRQKVKEIRFMYSYGDDIKQIAKKFSVTPDNIKAIIHRKSWKHI